MLTQVKHFGVVVLSILVLYAGVACALHNCWSREGHSDHPASGTHHNSSSSLGHPGASDDSLPLTHCFALVNRIGPAAMTATTTLSQPIEGTYLNRFHATPPVSVAQSNSGLLIFLNRNLTFSFLAGIPHHLFLSVLHI